MSSHSLPGPVVVTGAGGFVGRAVVDRLGPDAIPLNHAALDIGDASAVETTLERLRPWALINAAAQADVDASQRDPDGAWRVNADGPGHLARTCARLGIRLAHISTDYVFGGDLEHTYQPGDPTGPVNHYGESKLEGEKRVREALPGAIIARTAWVYGIGGRGFGATLPGRLARGEQIAAIPDRWAHPTYVRHLADRLVALLEAGASGTFHVVNGGPISWYDFALRFADRLSYPRDRIVATSRDRIALAAPRAIRIALADPALERLGLSLPGWEAAQDAYIAELTTSSRAFGATGSDTATARNTSAAELDTATARDAGRSR